jgi:hypothetical protein
MDEYNYLPALFKAASSSSTLSQGNFTRVYFLNLISLVLITIGSSISPFFATKERVFLFIVIGLLFILSLILTIIIKLVRWENVWYTSRAVAESVKSMSWKYMAGSEPYKIAIDINFINEAFLSDMQNVLNEIKNNNILKGGTFGTDDQITNEMRRIRSLNITERKEYYLENRIKEQREWYSKRAKTNHDKANKFFVILILCQLLAIFFSFYMVADPEFTIKFPSILATLTSSILAWLQVKKHQELSQSYSIAAQDLGLIQDKSNQILNDEQLSVFVADAETAISREHTMWLARRDVFNYTNLK